jgi:hypothetical protein
MLKQIYLILALVLCSTLNLRMALADEDPAKQTDVTQKLVGLVKENRLAFKANNDLFGDPANGEIKSVRIIYTDGDKTLTAFFMEDSDVSLSASDGKTLTVKEAVYGVLEGTLDVTDKVAAAVNDNALSISADNDTLGADPANGIAKVLTVNYTVDGVAQTKTANEGDTLTISKPDGGKPLSITHASYGPPDSPTTAPAPAQQ